MPGPRQLREAEPLAHARRAGAAGPRARRRRRAHRGKVAGAAPAAAATSGSDGASPAAEAYSTTNNQEEGVDEPDLVKTDGSTIFTVVRHKLEAVSVERARRSSSARSTSARTATTPQLLLRGNRLIVISSQAPRPDAAPGPDRRRVAFVRGSPYFAYGRSTELTEVDVADPSAMKVTQTLSDRRQLRRRPPERHERADRHLLGAARDRRAALAPRPRAGCRRGGSRTASPAAASPARSPRAATIRRPVQFSGLGMLTIVTLDFDKGLGAAHTDALMADAQIVYGSQTSLYVATQKWVEPVPVGRRSCRPARRR